LKVQRRYSPILYVLPALLIILLFRTIPILGGFLASLADYDIGGFHGFVGTSHYQRMLSDPRFWLSFGNTVHYVLGTLPAGIVIPLGLAVTKGATFPMVEGPTPGT